MRKAGIVKTAIDALKNHIISPYVCKAGCKTLGLLVKGDSKLALVF